jgi:hypothetical protein
MSNLKTLQCPFCGGRAEVIPIHTREDPAKGYQVACVNARADSLTYCPTGPFTSVYATQNAAITQWNMRAEP